MSKSNLNDKQMYVHEELFDAKTKARIFLPLPILIL